MSSERLTGKFQNALASAQSLALGKDHQFIEPLHLMLALIDQQGGTVRPLLMQAQVDVDQLRNQIEQALQRLPQVQGTGGEVHVSNDLKSISEFDG